jgi:hypothetical protein
MKKLALTLVAVAIVAVLIVGILYFNYDLTSNAHIEIISFNTTETSSGSSIGVVNVWFVLNLTNTGVGDAKNLTVTFSTNTTNESSQQLVYTNSMQPYDQIFEFKINEVCLLGGIKAGETKDFMFYWAVSSDSYAPLLTATLKSNTAILDQATVSIPPIPNVKITTFVYTGVFHGTRLGPMLELFSLSYANFGTTEVKDLTVTLNTSKTTENYVDPYNRTSTPNYDPYDFIDETINGINYPLESLKVKETKIFEKTYSLQGGFLLVQPFALTVTLKSNDTTLDQATILISYSG